MAPSAVALDISDSSSSNGHSNGYSSGRNGFGAANAANAIPKLAELDASKLVYNLTKKPAPLPSDEQAYHGDTTICTDHVVSCSWSTSTGWGVPELKPVQNISLPVTASCLHYGTTCFEGLKVYRGYDGKLRVFRPNLNSKRFLVSATRVSLPGFSVPDMEALFKALPAVDGARWLDRPGSFLYLRPAIIGTSAQLGVREPHQALLFITLSYMPNLSAQPLRLQTSPGDTVRAWEGGFGYAKVGANYGPTLAATREARERGFGQVLWLYGPQGFCTEAGASNFFIVWRTRAGALQLVTAPIDDRVILDGVTRKSVLELARERLAGELDVVERRYTIDEVVEASREGRLVEAFASGTAYFVCAVEAISHKGELVNLPLGKNSMGRFTGKFCGWIKGIQYGVEEHPWGVVIDERNH